MKEWAWLISGLGAVVLSCAALIRWSNVVISEASSNATPAQVGMKLSIGLIVFGVTLLWLVYPLMSRGHLRHELQAHSAARLCVVFGLTILLLSVVAGFFSGSLR